MASSSSSKKRALSDREKDFQSLTGLGISDTAVKKVIARLQGDESIEKNSSLRKSSKRFKDIADFIVDLPVVDRENNYMELHFVNLEKFLQKACEKHKDFGTWIKEELCNAQAGFDGIDAWVYVDEVVVGNPLRPDNRRKSYCMYMTYQPLLKYRSTALWWPLSVIRHEEADRLKCGVAEWFTEIIKGIGPDFNGLVLDDSSMVCVKNLYLIADEGAIKAITGSKGASGMRPCIHCNAFSKDRTEMAESMGHASISSAADEASFEKLLDSDIYDILDHLKQVRGNETKKNLETAQTLLGWNFLETSPFVCPEVLRFLTPQRVHYDAMHIYWSNGMVNQEIGLFLSAAKDLVGFKIADFQTFLNSNWHKSSCIGASLSDQTLLQLVYPKLIPYGADYKGTATQCLELLPLLAFFAIEILDGCQELKEHIRSLTLLWLVTTKVLTAKQEVTAIRGLRDLQVQHFLVFRSVYGIEAIRPKHHFSLHLEEQAMQSSILADCFPGERKNGVFKNTLCVHISRLHGFEKAVLQSWLELDLNKFDSFVVKPSLNVKKIQDNTGPKNLEVAKGMVSMWGPIKNGNVYLLNESKAVQVLGCTMCKVSLVYFITVSFFFFKSNLLR